jgi:lipopolysaccharide export system ATP-binding protein
LISGGIGMSLKAEGLVKVYDRKRVVDEVSLDVQTGEIVGLLGPNGAGKTTSFYMIVGIEKANSGKVIINGFDVTKWPMYKRARHGLGYLSQETSIFRKLTVEQNLMAVLEIVYSNAKTQRAKLEELLEEFNLTNLRNQRGYSLSGGERRRTEVARAMVTSPSFILLDEPFAGIDPIAVHDFQNIIAHLKRKGIGVLITDHNVRETLEITDRAYILYEGKIMVSGDSKQIINDPTARKLYLGERFNL